MAPRSMWHKLIVAPDCQHSLRERVLYSILHHPRSVKAASEDMYVLMQALSGTRLQQQLSAGATAALQLPSRMACPRLTPHSLPRLRKTPPPSARSALRRRCDAASNAEFALLSGVMCCLRPSASRLCCQSFCLFPDAGEPHVHPPLSQ